MTRISIIICCYNSSSRLKKTIQDISKLNTKNVCFEVVIIDNNSSDDTSLVAKELVENFNIEDYSIVLESKPGLTNARKTGVLHSNCEIIIFCDDDNWLEKDYLINVAKGFKKYPNAGILGAWSDAAFEKNQIVPDWFDEVKGAMAVGGKPNSDCLVKEVWGAGMAIRKELATQIFKSNQVLSDRTGTSLISGGDSEICEKAIELGYEIYKLISLKYTHFITPDRLSWEYLIRLSEGFGYSNMQKQYYNYNKSLIHLFLGYGLYSIKTILNNPQAFIFFLIGKRKTSQMKFHGIKGAWKFLLKK